MKKNICKGWIYCLSNQGMPSIYKIGYSEFLEKRVVELQKSGVPYPFQIEFAKNVCQPFEKEQKIHEILKKDRISKKREFFKTDLQEIKQLFDLVDGLWYENIEKTIGKYICKNFNGKAYYGIVFNTTTVKNNQTKNDEKVCCIIYEDNDREDMNFQEFDEFHCSSKKIPDEIREKLCRHNVHSIKNKNPTKNNKKLI
jgi:hypothetical protein